MTRRDPGSRRRHLVGGALLVALLGGVASTTGCSPDPRTGWSGASAWPEAYRSVAVPILQNRTYARHLDAQLTEALVKQIEASTPYKVMGQGTADTVLRGTITAVDLREISKSLVTGLGEEVALRVTLDYEWVDLRTGRTIVARRGFVGTAVFTPSRPTREPLELAGFEVAQQLAREIVDSMQSEW
jgi:hypothetical protein